MAKVKFRDISTFTLRMPPDLKQRLEKIAKGKLKGSLNSEIIERLEESLVHRHALPEFTDGELIDELIRRWGRENVAIHLGKLKE